VKKELDTLADEVAIVTGASSGIGAATARELARRGARVVLAARRVVELQARQQAITATGGQAIVVPTDVADSEQVTHLVERTRGAFGRVDIVVNDAGVSWIKQVAASSPEEIARVVDVNLLGAMLLTRAALPEMLERRHGAIISVGSVSSRVAMEPIYSATKFGLRGFSLALRRQLAGTGVSVSLVTPGNIRTAMTSSVPGRLPEPECVANTIADLVVHPRREVIIPRRHHVLVWLEQLLPEMADWAYHARNWSRVN
jgi:NADP-dependent 3-hydroxy acid dehydrogenase YdfG